MAHKNGAVSKNSLPNQKVREFIICFSKRFIVSALKF